MMPAHIPPVQELSGVINLPASKSFSIRALMIAGCGGSSTIIRPSNCDDAIAARQVIGQLGAGVRRSGDDIWRVEAPAQLCPAAVIDVNESGTVLRFLLPLISALGEKTKVVGRGTLRGRPNLHLTRTLRAMGADIKGRGENEGIPVICRGGRLRGGRLKVDGSLSSQFISALLITCPLLEGDTVLRITGRKLVSRDYIVMTKQVLELAGIRIQERGHREYVIPGRQVFRGLRNFQVPSDYGLAAFPLAAAALLPSEVTLKGYFNDRFAQADGAILPFLEKMGAEVRRAGKSLKIKGPSALKGGIFSLKDCPDLVPVMSVLAMFAEGRTVLKDISHVRAKESDRISDLRRELLKAGADARETEGSLVIMPRAQYRAGALLDPRNDHRLAMAFSVLGMKIGTRVKDLQCVSKSYPDFTRDIRQLGAVVKFNR
jgi:3-phosphoshikimate 1-carboxyvinyltransferase